MSRRTFPPVLALLIALGGVAWVRALQGKSGGSLTTRDDIDIQQLYARYYQAIDASDGEGWAATFTRDGVFNNVKGHDALAEYVKRAGPNRPLRHFHSNLTITATPEGASGSVYVMQIDVKARPLTLSTYSKYNDTLVKTAQGWRFKTRMRSADTTITPTIGPSGQSDK